MRTKELFGLLLWSTFGSLQAFAQVSYLHSDTQNAAWTVMPEEEVGKDMLRLTQNGYQNPKAVKAVVPGTVFTSLPAKKKTLISETTYRKSTERNTTAASGTVRNLRFHPISTKKSSG
mgnify:CR=1 FL=1